MPQKELCQTRKAQLILVILCEGVAWKSFFPPSFQKLVYFSTSEVNSITDF